MDETADLRVSLGDLVVVTQRKGAPAGRGIGKVAIRRVRLEEMDPQEEPVGAVAFEPLQCLVHDETPRPLIYRGAAASARKTVAV